MTNDIQHKRKAWSVLIVSTWSFTVCFMVWMMFGVIGIPIKKMLDLNATQFGLLTAMPVLTRGNTAITGLSRCLPELPATTTDLQASKSSTKSAILLAAMSMLILVLTPDCCPLGVLRAVSAPPVAAAGFPFGLGTRGLHEVAEAAYGDRAATLIAAARFVISRES